MTNNTQRLSYSDHPTTATPLVTPVLPAAIHLPVSTTDYNMDSKMDNPMMMGGKRIPTLVLVKQPRSCFYKDEGGKNNCLTAEVALPDGYHEEVAIRIRLHYESGAEVEEVDQNILKPLGNPYDPILVRPRKVTPVEFRLEKVSRRKDGQRFKVYIYPEHDNSLSGVFTCPITVLSKRKTGERHISRPAPLPLVAPAAGAGANDVFLTALAAKINTMTTMLIESNNMLRKQASRIDELEDLLRGRTAVALPAAPPTLRTGLSLDSVDASMWEADMDKMPPAAQLKRIRSTEICVDFGPPADAMPVGGGKRHCTYTRSELVSPLNDMCN